MTSRRPARARAAVGLFYAVAVVAATLALFASRAPLQSHLATLSPGAADASVLPPSGSTPGAAAGAVVTKRDAAATVAAAVPSSEGRPLVAGKARIAIGLRHRGTHRSKGGTKPSPAGGKQPKTSGGTGPQVTPPREPPKSDASNPPREPRSTPGSPILTVRTRAPGEGFAVAAGDGGLRVGNEGRASDEGSSPSARLDPPTTAEASDDYDSGLGISVGAAIGR